jgi:beta-lactamase superfamily II metal-dependent hydrolase
MGIVCMQAFTFIASYFQSFVLMFGILAQTMLGGFGPWGRLFHIGDFLDHTPLSAYTATIAGDKIHFLNTGGADAILLESKGHFALIDAAEDSDNPKNDPALGMDGTEAYVLRYIKRVTKGHLDFVLGTHSHSDHIGGMDTVILDPGVQIDKAYLKKYDAKSKAGYEKKWDNQEVYDQMVAVCKTRHIPLEQDNITDAPFKLGNFTLRIFNGAFSPNSFDENDNSLGVLVQTTGGLKAFLAGDINWYSADEAILAPQIGKVDLLKAGHHGYIGSNGLYISTILKPTNVIYTNEEKSVMDPVKRSYAVIANSRQMATGTYGGIVAVFNATKLNFYAISEYPTGKAGRTLAS